MKAWCVTAGKDRRMWKGQSVFKEEKETTVRTFRSYFCCENCNLNRMYEHVPFRMYLVCVLPPTLILETRSCYVAFVGLELI